MAIAGALVYPSIVALASATDVTCSACCRDDELPVRSSRHIMVQGYPNLLNKVLPHWLRNFTAALCCSFPSCSDGRPLTTTPPGISRRQRRTAFPLARWRHHGRLRQVFVLFGLHWGFVPIIVNDLATGLLALSPPATVSAQAAASRVPDGSKDVRSPGRPRCRASSPASPSLAIYGVNLPLKPPSTSASPAAPSAVRSRPGAAAHSLYPHARHPP